MNYWELSETDLDPAEAAAAWDARAAKARRFVLHRHRDAHGPHLDLRLEQDGYLLGWRIAGDTLGSAPWATEKAPHPLRWLDHDADAQRDDAGDYVWLHRERDAAALLLRGTRGFRRVDARRQDGLPPCAARALVSAMRAGGHDPGALAGLVADGAAARQRAVARLCGLGRELDGAAFDPGAWRHTLAGLDLAGIHRHLRAFEARFDAKYPRPVSRPEALPEAAPAGPGTTARALAILHP
jgi:hypothetical protein